MAGPIFGWGGGGWNQRLGATGKRGAYGKHGFRGFKGWRGRQITERKRRGPAIDIALEVQGLDEAIEGFEDASGRILDLRPVLEEIARRMREHIGEGFDSEGRATGRKWRELRPSTVRKRGSAHPILQVTGTLRRSFTERFDPGHVERYEPTALTIGSTYFTAWWHQFGRRHMAKRPILRFGSPEKLDELIVEPLEQYLDAVMAGAGL